MTGIHIKCLSPDKPKQCSKDVGFIDTMEETSVLFELNVSILFLCCQPNEEFAKQVQCLCSWGAAVHLTTTYLDSLISFWWHTSWSPTRVDRGHRRHLGTVELFACASLPPSCRSACSVSECMDPSLSIPQLRSALWAERWWDRYSQVARGMQKLLYWY